MSKMSKYYVLLLICSILFIDVIQSQSPIELGMEETTVTYRYPYIASLQNSDGVHFCTGVLISPYTVLTSAKCVDDKLLGGVHNPEIWINSIDLSFLNTTSVVIRGVNETIFHPEYIIDPSSGNNIALLVLDEAVTEVSAIRLGEDEVLRSNELGLDEGSIIYFLGYGGTAGTSSYSSVLIRGTWSLEPDSLCLNYITGDYNSVIMNCGIGSSPCYGDMGGPVFWNSPGEDSADQDALIGILSVLDCGDEVSSYLDISGHFYDWVYEMRNNISARYEDSGSTELSPEEIAARLAELYEYYGVDLVNDGDEDYSALGSYFSEEENG